MSDTKPDRPGPPYHITNPQPFGEAFRAHPILWTLVYASIGLLAWRMGFFPALARLLGL